MHILCLFCVIGCMFCMLVLRLWFCLCARKVFGFVCVLCTGMCIGFRVRTS